MAGGQLAIKARIRSVDSTKKITKAMQLVATSKLKKQKSYMEKNREYAKYLKDTVQDILANLETTTHPYLKKNKQGKKLLIVFTSDMGLCGGYNANVLRLLEQEKDSEIVMIGSRGAGWIANKGFEVKQTYINLEDECYSDLVGIADEALERYRNGELSEIRILFTAFVNSVTFTPEFVTLLPVQEEVHEDAKSNQDTLFEPQGDQILNTLVPMYVRSLLYSYYLQTKTSEQASRRMAMENATDNAEELKETLELQFNQARQAAITQEITEIVGGANAIE